MNRPNFDDSTLSQIDSRPKLGDWTRSLAYLVHHARILGLVLRHHDAPWSSRLVAACAVGYLFSPIQLIPTFIPVIGQMDDAAVLLAGMKLVRRLTPKAILKECEERAASYKLFQWRPLNVSSRQRKPKLANPPSPAEIGV
jgi:uncharacterized membrane protein YkvA (DUF1232 family)